MVTRCRSARMMADDAHQRSTAQADGSGDDGETAVRRARVDPSIAGSAQLCRSPSAFHNIHATEGL